MLASISTIQPIIQLNQTSQHSFETKNDLTENLKKQNEDTVKSESSKLTGKALEQLSREDQAKIQQLKNRDLEVKAHEQAHLSAAGTLALGGASFTYTNGPNGVRYATGGEVSIDTSVVNEDPAATIRKADAIRRAALAPATPSSQDQLVANNATAMSETARTELIQLAQEEKENAIKTKGTESEEEQNDSNNKIETRENSVSTTGSLIDFSV
jgi:hypothetical protein